MPIEQQALGGAGRGQPGTLTTGEAEPGRLTPSPPLNSPAGGGGPGHFTYPGPLDGNPEGSAARDAGHPSAPIPAQASRPNPPPSTSPRSLGEQKKSNSQFHDVLIEARIIADGTSDDARVSAKTSFSVPVFNAPGYDFDGSGKITAFKGKFEWRGTLTIQTVYGPGAGPRDVSCYGRGTTAGDRQKGDITLGFHESCHREDYANYLANHALPNPPEMRIGMSKQSYEAEKARFQRELNAYRSAMERDSEARTDEVGHKRSTYRSSGKCYVHQVP